MSIKIHHGGNGAFKTSGAIQDDAIPALEEGRLIITNVRGFTRERVFEVMPHLPSSVEIINLSLESVEDMERMRTWFQWAPRGAFIIFDETQLVFPKAWREKELERFDFPGGPEAASAADRPMGWLDGWTRHRHWNWDIVLTTPNISYIRDDIRMTCEMAYKHVNLAVIGIKGRYKEAQHDAQINRPPMDGTIVEYKQIKPRTFRLYDSTTTGKAQDTKAGKSLLKSPRILLLLALIAGSVSYFLLSGGTAVITDGVGASSRALAGDTPGTALPDVAAQVPAASPLSAVVRHVADGQAPAPAVELNHPFAPRTFSIRGVMTGIRDGQLQQFGQLDVMGSDGAAFRQSIADLQALGYHLRVRGNCLIDISHPLGFKGQAICPGQTQTSKGQPLALTPPIQASQPASTGMQPQTLTRVTVVPDSEYPARPWR